VVFNCRMLHLELAASVSGMTHIHGLCVEDVDLEEVARHQLLKSFLILSPLHFPLFH